MNKRVLLCLILLAGFLALCLYWILIPVDANPPVDAVSHRVTSSPAPRRDSVPAPSPVEAASRRVSMSSASTPSPADAASLSVTDDDAAAARAEQLVDAFDARVDRWMEPSAKEISERDVTAFVEAFRRLPDDRKDESIQRALNLIPDENVMLLVGVLMDKGVSKDIAETVYNDILNRDEDVKKPILRQIYKDKTHPCWADTAWILDVTGEK